MTLMWATIQYVDGKFYLTAEIQPRLDVKVEISKKQLLHLLTTGNNALVSTME